MDEKYITLLSMDENFITIFYPNDVFKKQKKGQGWSYAHWMRDERKTKHKFKNLWTKGYGIVCGPMTPLEGFAIGLLKHLSMCFLTKFGYTIEHFVDIKRIIKE